MDAELSKQAPAAGSRGLLAILCQFHYVRRLFILISNSTDVGRVVESTGLRQHATEA